MGGPVIDTFSGILKRDGVELKCTIMARRVNLPGTDIYEHVRPTIMSVDGPVSNGNYDLYADGKISLLKRVGEHWLAR